MTEPQRSSRGDHDTARRRVTWQVLADASTVPALADRVGVDIPIGLPWGSLVREADGAARRRLPGKASSVFPTPVRAVLEAATYAEACEVSRAECGRAISKQTWFITPKIRDMDDALAAAGPGVDDRVAEVHPEAAFALLAGGPPAGPKKTAEGRAEREHLLAAWLGTDDAGVRGLVDAAPRPARPDDALDALACAYVAWRWARGQAEALGDPAARDQRGRPMRILL